MLAAQQVIRISQATGRFAQQTRTTIGTPPRVRIPFAEKVAHGMLIAVGLLATPAYVAVNIKNYRPPGE